jgi:hypothetical protein
MNGSITLDKPKFALLAVVLLLLACLFLATPASAAAPEPATLTVLGSPVLGGPGLPDCHLTVKAYKFWDKNNNGIKDGSDVWLSGWEITLTKPDGSTIVKTTDANGYAYFGTFTASGTYKLTETMQAGWTNTTPIERTKYYSASVDVTWTEKFSNWQIGKIVVVEQTIPSPDPTSTSFPFTAGGGLSPASFNLVNAGTQTFDNLTPGSGYNVAQNTPSPWILVSATCDNGSPISNIDVGAGETVTCTFVNRLPQGTIIVKEETIPSPDPTSTSFPFTAGGMTPTSFNLTNGGTQTYSGLLPGSGYSVSQGTPTSIYQWTLESATCDNGSPITAIVVDDGKTTTCTFVNRLGLDFGDAPDDGVQYNFKTTLANDGARHAAANLFLGTVIDVEDDADLIPASPAKGDDLTAQGDEDGVDRGKDPWSDSAGVVYVTVTGGDGCLNAWWDITQPGPSGVMAGSNGIFDGADQIITNYPVIAGVNTVNFNFPAVVVPFDYETVGATYVRFRLSPRNATGSCTATLAPVGLEPDAASPSVGTNGLVLNGEVEDYQWGFGSNAVTLQGFSAASQASRSAGLPLLGLATILVSGLAIVWNRGRKVAMKSESKTVSTETGKTYVTPAIVHEMDLETRAGSPLGAQQFNPVLGPEFQEVK